MNTIEEMLQESEPNLTHLHLHTDFSFLDGFNNPKRAAARAKELGMTAMAITDHNHVGGVIDFQSAMKAEGIKPILGCEMYWTHDTNVMSLSVDDRVDWAIEQATAAGFDVKQAIYEFEHPISKKTGKPLKPKKISKKDLNAIIEPYAYDMKQFHIIFLVMNQTGWKNLISLQSEAAEKCTYNGRYLCDDEMIKKYSEGLIMTTACASNILCKHLDNGDFDKFQKQLDAWHNIFGDRLYLEIQPWNNPKQHRLNIELINYGLKNNVKVIATTDVHYTMEDDWDDHDTLIAIGIGKAKNDPTREMKYSNDYWIRSYDEMIQAFETQADSMSIDPDYEYVFKKDEYMNHIVNALAMTNTVPPLIEDIKLGSDINLFPNIDIPFGLTAESYLTMLCFQNLYKYKVSNPHIDIKLYERRINDELKVINTKGFAPYILVVQDYIDWANNNGCPTGPGRGSGAGSLVLFLLGITRIIDPIQNGLLFFRFLTMDRSAPPDIDTDFEYFNRDRVIEYLQNKYGHECVAHIGTYTEMGVKSGLKDVGRALGIDYMIMDEITKKVDTWSDNPSLKFKDLDELADSTRENDKAAYAEFKSYESRHAELFRIARKFEGTKRGYGVHASGVLITPMPVSDLFPTRYKDGITITLYTGVQLEDLKAIKFDILGLKTLSVIQETIKAIDENLTMDDLYKMVDVDDPEMFRMIQEKETDGLFQIESNLFKGMVENIVPNTMNDIVVITSLGRPGPLSAGMDKAYADRKHGREEAIEPLPGTWEVVSDTHGTICYQEQIMIISKIVANFDDNQSDSYLRKAFAKKKKDKMAQCRQWFIYGKHNTVAPEGYDPENKNQVDYDPKGKCGPAIKGGIANGYEEQTLIDFWTSIEGFADYLFNKSHAACYSYLTVLTGWLKKYYPAEFMAALMTMQSDAKKIDNYTKVARKMGIEVLSPDVNMSKLYFTPINGQVVYGLGNVTGIGASSIPDIVANQPYESLEDLMERVPRKSINKRVIIAMAKAGCFDRFDSNRYRVINQIYDLRGDKDPEYLNEDTWDDEACIEFEKEVLGTPVTCIPFWDGVPEGEEITINLKLKSISEKIDKNGNMMAFVNGSVEGSDIKCVIFSSTYCKNVGKFDIHSNSHVELKGKKDSRSQFVVNRVLEAQMKTKPAPPLVSKSQVDEEPSDITEDFTAFIESLA